MVAGGNEKVVEAGLVRGRSTEEKVPGSKWDLSCSGEKGSIPGERMRQRRCRNEAEHGVGCLRNGMYPRDKHFRETTK